MAVGEWEPEWLTNIFHIGDLHTALLLQRFNRTSSPRMSEGTRERASKANVHQWNAILHIMRKLHCAWFVEPLEKLGIKNDMFIIFGAFLCFFFHIQSTFLNIKNVGGASLKMGNSHKVFLALKQESLYSNIPSNSCHLFFIIAMWCCFSSVFSFLIAKHRSVCPERNLFD